MLASTAQTFADFQGSIKQISPILSKDEQNKVSGVFSDLHHLVLTSWTFLAKTIIRVKCATTNSAILAAVDVAIVRKLGSQTQSLLTRFWPSAEPSKTNSKTREHYRLARRLFGPL